MEAANELAEHGADETRTPGEAELDRIVPYVEYKPVRAGLAADPREWHWWSARLAGESGCPTIGANPREIRNSSATPEGSARVNGAPWAEHGATLSVESRAFAPHAVTKAGSRQGEGIRMAFDRRLLSVLEPLLAAAPALVEMHTTLLRRIFQSSP